MSDDNLEFAFKTLRYHSTFPERLGSLEGGRSYLGLIFEQYNSEHRRSGIAS